MANALQVSDIRVVAAAADATAGMATADPAATIRAWQHQQLPNPMSPTDKIGSNIRGILPYNQRVHGLLLDAIDDPRPRLLAGLGDGCDGVAHTGG